MAHSYWLGSASLAVLVGCFAALSACSSDDHPPGSLVSAGGASAQGGGADAGTGGKGDAGEAPDSGSPNGDEGGAAGEPSGITPPPPVAVYPGTLDVDVSCTGSPEDASLRIQNAGGSTLSIASASADSGYVVKTKFPLSIEPGQIQIVLVTPPAPASNAQVGNQTNGTLSFITNEPDMPTHTVTLNTELFGAQLEFTDHDGVPLGTTLTLTYLSNDACPDTLKYRVHNKGNVAFTLIGPTFPANFGGTTTGATGQGIAPDGYVELLVGGVSSPGNVCTASGTLSFTTQGSFCGSAPTLNVVWPASAGPCACALAQ